MDFYKRASLVVNKIPRGKVATYGQIALLCGKPGNARQVGYALKWERLGRAPAHRVVNSAGVLRGALAFETFDRQKWLLEKEGVEVADIPGGFRVELKRYRWENTFEEALWLKQEFDRLGI
nr:MGMT family protein [uncultured Acetatifactor sp.]